jgi:hypothetical protein
MIPPLLKSYRLRFIRFRVWSTRDKHLQSGSAEGAAAIVQVGEGGKG